MWQNPSFLVKTFSVSLRISDTEKVKLLSYKAFSVSLSVAIKMAKVELVDMFFYTADMTCFDIDEFLAVVLLPRLTFLYVEDYCIHSTLLDRTRGIFFEHNRVLQTMLPLVLNFFLPSFCTIISLQGQDYRISALL
ncbi:hypothetical protein [Nostoc punctiforme]|uniref:hypothetical protein n=1 Tax=Nostoc punctiforme TaxID=272131 RepID=UPI000045BD5B|nr:hypothetical protein [Nostoc punctiforme]